MSAFARPADVIAAVHPFTSGADLPGLLSAKLVSAPPEPPGPACAAQAVEAADNDDPQVIRQALRGQFIRGPGGVVRMTACTEFFNFVCGPLANGIQEDGRCLGADVRQRSPDEGRLR